MRTENGIKFINADMSECSKHNRKQWWNVAL